MVHSKLDDINRLLKKHEDAVTQYRYAISGLENLLQKASANPEYRQALAYADNWLGETLRLWSEETHNQSDNRKEALDEYDSALRLQQPLHEEAAKREVSAGIGAHLLQPRHSSDAFQSPASNTV
jgi:hypothetical protein